jgi:septum formation protein
VTRLILASASPRRRELLGRLGVAFEVHPVDADETPRPGEAAADLVRRLAVAKAEAALVDLAGVAGDDTVVVAADTEVVLDGEVLGKPADADDAARILRRLAGRTHEVLTGVAVAASWGDTAAVESRVARTAVTMTDLSAQEIAWYVGTGEPLDKAGAYGIQGAGGLFVSSIEGSYDNVVGLPLALTRRLLAVVGITPGSAPGQPPEV